MQYVLAAFADATTYLKAILHVEDGGEAHLNSYLNYVHAALREALVKPLCRDVENDLRLRIHTKSLQVIS